MSTTILLSPNITVLNLGVLLLLTYFSSNLKFNLLYKIHIYIPLISRPKLPGAKHIRSSNKA